MPSQSPMKGSTKYRTSKSPTMAGTNHHGQARRNERVVEVGVVTAALAGRLEIGSDVTGMLVVGCAWFNVLSFDRTFRSLYHLYAITLRIVLNFIHDVVDEQHATARRLEKICGVAGIGNGLHIKAFAFILDGKARLFWR